MAIFSRAKALILTFFLLLILTPLDAQPVFNGDIGDILPTYGLPPGLFPSVPNAASIDSNGEMTLALSTRCRIPVRSSRFSSSSLYYDKNVTGVISYGRIEAVTGIRYAVLNLAANPVISIEAKVDGNPPTTQILFNTKSLGTVTFDWDFFNPIPECVPWINVAVS